MITSLPDTSHYSVRTQRTYRTYLRVSGNRHRSYWHPLHIGAIHWSQEDIILWHTYNDDYDDFDDDNDEEEKRVVMMMIMYDDDNDEEEEGSRVVMIMMMLV